MHFLTQSIHIFLYFHTLVSHVLKHFYICLSEILFSEYIYIQLGVQALWKSEIIFSKLMHLWDNMAVDPLNFFTEGGHFS